MASRTNETSPIFKVGDRITPSRSYLRAGDPASVSRVEPAPYGQKIWLQFDAGQKPGNDIPYLTQMVEALVEPGSASGLAATLAAREATYGSFADKARVIQALKALAAGSPMWDKLDSDEREGIDMIFTKIGRLLFGTKGQQDTWHDIAGYAKLVDGRMLAKPALFGDNYSG